MPSYLVIKTSALGDIIQTLSTVAKIKSFDPKCKIAWVVEKRFSSFLKKMPFIDEVIECDFKAWKKAPIKSLKLIKEFIQKLKHKRIDIALDFQGNTKSGLILAFTIAKVKRGFDKKTVAEWPNLLFSTQKIASDLLSCHSFYDGLAKDLIDHDYDLSFFDQVAPALIENARGKKVIMLGFGSMWESKRLSMIQAKALMGSYKDQNPYFLIPAMPNEVYEYSTLLDGFEGEIIEEAAVFDYLKYFKLCDLFIGVDSALYHLAKFLKVKTLGIFGPSSKLFYGNKEDVQGICPFGESFIKRCPKLRSCKAPCMKEQKF